MPLDEKAKSRVFRIAFFVAVWFSMACMLMTAIWLAALIRTLAQDWDLALSAYARLVSHGVFLWSLVFLVGAALVKEPFMPSNHVSFLVNSLFLLVAAWISMSVVATFLCLFTDVGGRMGG